MTAANPANAPVPEMELLCACVAPAPPETISVRPVDWARFLTLATNHHVLPLVQQAVKNGVLAGIPAEHRSYLQRRCLAISAANLRSTAILQRLQHRLDSAGIQLVPVKGPALAALAYGSTALRQFEDLDLLVKPGELLRAVTLLAEEGYAAWELPPSASRGRYLAWRQDWSLRKPGDPVHLDLKPVLISHTLCDVRSVDFMARACRPVPIGEGRMLRAPGPEAMLLAVCVDGANEMWGKLSAVADAAALLANYPAADWAGLLQAAAGLGQKRSLLIGTTLAGRLLAGPRPAAFARERDSTASALAAAAAWRLQAGISLQTGIVRQCGFAWRSRDTLRARGRYLGRLLFVPGAAELRQIALPPALYPLYSCLRPFRLGWRAWRGPAPRPDPEEAGLES